MHITKYNIYKCKQSKMNYKYPDTGKHWISLSVSKGNLHSALLQQASLTNYSTILNIFQIHMY